MFGVENGLPEGRSFLEVIRQKDLLDLVQEVRVSGAPARHELELGPPVNRVVAARGAPLGLGPGAPGVLLVLNDVTELRRLERVRSEFVANVSHELRTPLTCIKGYLETLLDGALDDRAHARRAPGPPDRRSARAVQHRERSRHAGAHAAGSGRRRRRG